MTFKTSAARSFSTIRTATFGALLLPLVCAATAQVADVRETADLNHFGDLQTNFPGGSPIQTAVDPVALGEEWLAVRRIGGRERFSLQIYADNDGVWGLEDEITEAGQSPTSSFGNSLSLSGDTLAVSYADDDLPGMNDVGSARIYRRDPQGVWLQEAKLTASDATSGAGLGELSLDGDRLLVGAAFLNSGATQAGAAYIFERTSSAWTELAKLEATPPVPFERLGRSVSLVGDLAFLGTRTGARVFRLLGNTWTEEASLTSPEFPAGNLASDGVTLGIVAVNTVLMTRPRSFLFEQVGGFWSLVSTVETSQVLPLAEFDVNTSIDLVQGRLYMGTDNIDNTNNPLLVGAWLAERTPSGWPSFADPFETRAPEGGLNSPTFTSVRDIAANGNRIAVLAPNLINQVQGSFGDVLIFDSASSPPTEFCFGSGAASGCGACPCNNASPVSFYGGCLSSAGTTPQLYAGGLPRLSRDTLRFDLRHAAPQSFALLFSGDRQLPAMGPCPPGTGVLGMPAADGLRCIGMNLIRHGTRALNADGTTSAPWGDEDPSTAPGLVTLSSASAGQVRHWQAYYREPVQSGCGTGIGTSQAISVTVAP